MPSTTCPDDNQLAAFAGGTLDDAQAGAVAEHLDACPTCLLAVASVAGDEGRAREPAPRPVAGDRVGPYVVERLLGQGGMGEVYAAHDEALGRKVALKVVSGAADDAARARLAREAQAMARLTHPNVVTVFALADWRGQPCIAMELVEGATLREWLRTPGRPREAVWSALRAAGQGLAAAHAAGVVHRDFKPGNVLLGTDGRVRVSDFGLSRPLEGPPAPAPAPSGDPLLTRTGAVLGTPAYMAPEQHQGLTADARSDQFSYAVTLAEALTGHRPFPGATVEELRATLHAAPRLDGLPVALQRPLRRALAVEPGDRFPDLAHALAALDDAWARATRPRRAPRWVALGVLGLLAGGAWVASRTPAAPAPPPSSTAPAPLRFELSVGELRLLSAPGVTRVAIGDPTLADVEVPGAGELLIRGLAPGETLLLVWTGNGRADYPLRVIARSAD